jgi:uncharacterized membrane protein
MREVVIAYGAAILVAIGAQVLMNDSTKAAVVFFAALGVIFTGYLIADELNNFLIRHYGDK